MVAVIVACVLSFLLGGAAVFLAFMAGYNLAKTGRVVSERVATAIRRRGRG